MYQHRNIHINDTQLQQIHISNCENRIYLHNAYGTEDSVNETNIQLTGADLGSSGDDYLKADNSEASAGNRDTMLGSSATDILSATYTFAPEEGKIPVFSELIAEYLSFPTIFCRKVRPSNNDRL